MREEIVWHQNHHHRDYHRDYHSWVYHQNHPHHRLGNPFLSFFVVGQQQKSNKNIKVSGERGQQAECYAMPDNKDKAEKDTP